MPIKIYFIIKWFILKFQNKLNEFLKNYNKINILIIKIFNLIEKLMTWIIQMPNRFLIRIIALIKYIIYESLKWTLKCMVVLTITCFDLKNEFFYFPLLSKL